MSQSDAKQRRNLSLLLLGIVCVVIGIDQLTKAWAESRLGDGEVIPVLGELLQLRLVYNPGAALSIANGQTWLITIFVVGISIAIIRLIPRLRSRWWLWAMGLVLAGGIGNLIDRLFREPGFGRGEVIDFIDYAGFFVGNVADIAIVGGAGIAIVLALLDIGFDGVRGASDRVEEAETDEDNPSDG